MVVEGAGSRLHWNGALNFFDMVKAGQHNHVMRNQPRGPSKSPRLFSLPFWCGISLLLPNLYFPFYFAMGAEEGGWLTAIDAFRWVAFSVLYWLPIGYMVFGRPGSTVKRLTSGFLLSIPAYFLCLWIVYPLTGFAFHPSSGKAWVIYFFCTVPCFLLIAGIAWLTGHRVWTRRLVMAIAILAFAAGLAWPISLLIGTDRYGWPKNRNDSWNLTGGNLVDLPSGQILTGRNIHISRGRIDAVVDGATDKSTLPRIDLAGAYILPGLIDVHVHLDAPVRSVLSPFDFNYLVEEEFSHFADHRRGYLENGITAIRDCGGPAVKLFGWRSAIAQHRLLGPRLFAVGRLVTAPQGHPVATIWKRFPYLAREGAILAGNRAELIQGLELNQKEGPPDAIKFIDGTIGLAKQIIDPKLMADGIGWAHERHYITVVHTETPAEIHDAVQDGATGVEHVATAGRLPPGLIAQMAAQHTYADPTFGELEIALRLRKISAAQRAVELQTAYSSVRQLAAAGVPLVIGTDAPLVPYGTGFLDELDQFKRAGFSQAEILTFATRNNAAYLGKPKTLGCISMGCNADLVVLSENPINNLRALRHPKLVFRDGIPVAGKKP